MSCTCTCTLKLRMLQHFKFLTATVEPPHKGRTPWGRAFSHYIEIVLSLEYCQDMKFSISDHYTCPLYIGYFYCVLYTGSVY